jgi:hypothetical protein
MQVLTCGVTDLVVSQVVFDGLAPLAAKGAETLGVDGGSGGGPGPASRAAGSDSLGAPQQRHLGQGAAVVSLDLPQAPVTCLDFWCRAGSAAETPAESGLAHFLEHMVFKGSERLAAGDFDLRIEALGGSSNAATGFDDVHYHVLVPPSAAAEAVDLLLDLVLAPRLDPEDFDLERQVVLEELARERGPTRGGRLPAAPEPGLPWPRLRPSDPGPPGGPRRPPRRNHGRLPPSPLSRRQLLPGRGRPPGRGGPAGAP